MGAFLGVPVGRTALRTRIFFSTPTALDRLLDSTADAAGIV